MATQPSGDRASCQVWDHSECEGTPHCPPRCPRFADSEGAALLARPYESADFDNLVAMYDALDDESRSLGLPPRRRADVEEWLRGLASDGWNLVAEHGDRIVGHVGVAPAEASTPQFVVFVHQAYRGRGIGTELLEQLVAYASDRDHDAVHLDVSKNNRRAIALYDDVGFDVLERRAADIAMELSLDRPIADRVRRPPARRD